MRVWGMSLRGYNVDSGGAFGADPDESADFFTQRFRLAAKITASEGVYGHLRFDFAEDVWGSENMGAARYGEGSELQVDRAYLEVDKEKYNVKAGQLLTGLGNYIVVDMQGQGMNLTYKPTPNLAVTFNWLKRDEAGDEETIERFYYDDEGDPITVNLVDEDGAPLLDEDGDPRTLDLSDQEVVDNQAGVRTDFEGVRDTEDLDVYSLNVAFSKEDKFSGNFFYATSIDNTMAETDSQNAIGLQGKAALGKINLNAEFDYLFGENKNTNKDYVGMQLYVDLGANINDSTMAGCRLIYAAGTDKADETQLSNLNRGAAFGDFLPFAFGIYDDGDWDSLLDGVGYHPMEIGGNGSGAMALAVYGEKVIKEKFALRGLLAYGAPAEDEATNLDSAIIINGGAEYEFAQDTVVQGCVNYIMPSYDDDRDDDAALGLFAGLRMNF